jgi:hypothetical protein
MTGEMGEMVVRMGLNVPWVMPPLLVQRHCLRRIASTVLLGECGEGIGKVKA